MIGGPTKRIGLVADEDIAQHAPIAAAMAVAIIDRFVQGDALRLCLLRADQDAHRLGRDVFGRAGQIWSIGVAGAA